MKTGLASPDDWWTVIFTQDEHDQLRDAFKLIVDEFFDPLEITFLADTKTFHELYAAVWAAAQSYGQEPNVFEDIGLAMADKYFADETIAPDETSSMAAKWFYNRHNPYSLEDESDEDDDEDDY